MDKVFCANAGILLNNKALVANFSAGPRKAESMYYLEYFNKHGFTTDLTKHRLEGAGDGLFSHGKRLNRSVVISVLTDCDSLKRIIFSS